MRRNIAVGDNCHQGTRSCSVDDLAFRHHAQARQIPSDRTLARRFLSEFPRPTPKLLFVTFRMTPCSSDLRAA